MMRMLRTRMFVMPVLLALLLMSFQTMAATPAIQWSKLANLPDREGFAGAFTGVADGRLVVAGGANFPDKKPWEGGTKVWYDAVYVLDKPEGAWRLAGRLPYPVGYGVSISLGKEILCIGGSDSLRHHEQVFSLSLAGEKVKTASLPSLPIPLANGCGVEMDGTVYVFGGSDQPGEKSALNRLFALDKNRVQWKELEACPGKPRILPVMAAVGDSFYIAGGAAIEETNGKPARVYLHDTWKYQPGKGWSRMADMARPSVAAPAPAPVVDSSFLIAGGDDGSLAGFKPVEKHPGFPAAIRAFDTRSNRWSEFGTAPVSRATVTTVKWGDAYIIPSGEARPGIRSPEVWSMKIDKTNESR